MSDMLLILFQIFQFCGQNVICDVDLVWFFDYKMGNFNKCVIENVDCFGDDFVF